MERNTAFNLTEKISRASAPNLLDQPESDLVKQTILNPEIFSELYKLYLPRVYYYLLDIVRNQADAEDLTSLTFISAYASINKLRDENKFSAWLFRIAKNKANDFFRRKKLTVEVSEEFLEILDQKYFSSPVIKIEELIVVIKMVNSLPAKDSELLRLKFVAQLTFFEISECLGGISENRVKKRYYEILKNLRREMEGEYGQQYY